MEKNEKLLRAAKGFLRRARRNVGKAWIKVEDMKLASIRLERLRPLHSLRKQG